MPICHIRHFSHEYIEMTGITPKHSDEVMLFVVTANNPSTDGGLSLKQRRQRLVE
jgi:hypothetical protein